MCIRDRAQLDYREENQKKVAAFHTTRTLGADTKVLLDEDAGKCMVTRARNLVEANPDVLDFADVTGCNPVSYTHLMLDKACSVCYNTTCSEMERCPSGLRS